MNGSNLFKTTFNWIFGKIYLLKNCQCEFHLCWCEIDYATFWSAFFCRHEIVWVRKSAQLPALILILQIVETLYIVENDVFLSLYVKCHYQIFFSKLNLNVVYLPSYQHLIWDYKKAIVYFIRKSLNSVGWNLLIKMLIKYPKYLMINIISNYISNKLITIDDKDPPWMNLEVNNKLKRTILFINKRRNIN